jgi:hypothetical protein
MCWAGQHPPQNNNKNKNWSHSFLTQCILRPSWSNIEFEPFICDLKTEPRRSQTKNKIKPANKNSRTRSRLCVWGTVPIYSSLGLCLSFSFNFNNFNEVTRIWIYIEPCRSYTKAFIKYLLSPCQTLVFLNDLPIWFCVKIFSLGPFCLNKTRKDARCFHRFRRQWQVQASTRQKTSSGET